MFYAIRDGERITATPKSVARCSGCGGEVRAKCGSVNVWHWAHVAAECDPWHEREGAWHLGWKSMAPKEWVEVSMGPHRADIRRPDGLVIELQASAISAEEIKDREEFYGDRMIWLLDGRHFNMYCHLGQDERERCCLYKEGPCQSYYHDGCASHPLHYDKPGLTRALSIREFYLEGRTKVFYMRPSYKHIHCHIWKQRKRSFDCANRTIYVDLGECIVELLRGKRSQKVPVEWWRRYSPEVNPCWIHTRQAFAKAAGLTWRPDALGH